MLCEECHQREAVVKFTQVIGNEKRALNLCKVCAENQGLSNPLVDISKVFGKIIIAILSEHLASQTGESIKAVEDTVVCKHCGLSWNDFKKTGRLGCSQCYDTYIDHLKILLRRLHGSNKHIGKKIQKEAREKRESVEVLKRKLKRAIEKEEYEAAAELRDHIRELKRSPSK